MDAATRVLLTGGSGALGTSLIPLLLRRGFVPVVLDLAEPHAQLRDQVEFVQGSILDRDVLEKIFPTIDRIVHIAAWHGIHEFRGDKGAHDFWDLNVTGTFNVFQAAASSAKVKSVVFISSTSVRDSSTLYGQSKLHAEQIARNYANQGKMNVAILRPRAFIPHNDTYAYSNYVEWARWFWKGAVHVSDVALAVECALDTLTDRYAEFCISTAADPLAVVVDGKYDYKEEDVECWDANGPGSTFVQTYGESKAELARQNELDISKKPGILRDEAALAMKAIKYQPLYSLANVLDELEKYGQDGPPHKL